MKTLSRNLEDTVYLISNCIKRLKFYDRHFLKFFYFCITCFLAFSTICYTMLQDIYNIHHWIIAFL